MATFKAHEQRIMREHNANVKLAWDVAVFSREKRLNKTAFDRMLMKPKKAERPRQTWQEQMAIMGQWAAIMNKQEKP